MRLSPVLVSTVLLLACGQKSGNDPASQKAEGKTEGTAEGKAGAKAEENAEARTEAPAPGGGETNGAEAVPESGGPVVEHVVQDIDGKDVNLSEYRGKAMLIVNTASECGNTPQYEGLQELHTRYGEKGLVVMGFPSNDFGQQEPGTHEEIKKFASENFGVTFPLFAKVKTKGEGQAPLYKTLTEETGDGIKGEVEWNFAKFLVNPEGRVVARFGNKVQPTAPEVVEAIESVLPEADDGR